MKTGLPGKTANTPTRQQQKAMDKEIPWQHILEQDQSTINERVKSAQAEESSWFSFNCVTPIDDKEAEHILSDPALRRRVLKSRAAYKTRTKGFHHCGQNPCCRQSHPDLHELCAVPLQLAKPSMPCLHASSAAST